MRQLIWGNLRARPVRTILSLLAVALQVFLLLIMMGLTDGIVKEWGKRIEGIGANLLVQQPGASMFLAFSRAVLPEEMGSQLAVIEGVASVAPVLAMVNNDSLTIIYGIDYDSFNRLGGGFLFHQGGPFQQSYDVIVDDIKATSKGLKVGHTITLLDHRFRVVGIVEHGRGARFFIPLKTVQELLDVKTVSMFWVKTTDPPGQVKERIAQVFPRHVIRLMDEYLSLMVSDNLPEMKPFVRAIVLVGLVITFLVVLLSMYTVVLERTREIGILKALGASRWSIVALLFEEAMTIGVAGALVGIGASYGTEALLTWLRPTLQIDIGGMWVVQGVLLALLGCALGSVYPALRAAAADPVAALAYE